MCPVDTRKEWWILIDAFTDTVFSELQLQMQKDTG